MTRPASVKRPVVFMYSGQGSQYYRMGEELYRAHPRFRLWMDYCDELVHPRIGTSLVDILYQGQSRKGDPFDQALYTNPALLCIEYSLTRVLMEMNLQPDYLLGYSLGEITAAVVSGAVALEDGIALTVDYAKLLAETPPAGMLAVLESEDIIARFPGLFGDCWLTGRNFQGNFVVSGLEYDIQRLQEALSRMNIISQKLPVRYGFHTRLIDPIEQEFKRMAQRINLSPPRLPVISALKTGPVEEYSSDFLWQVMRQPVEFAQTIRLMLRQEDYIFIDAGPSGTLATFVKYLLPAASGSAHYEAINQFGRDLHTIEKLKSALYAAVPATA